MKKKIGDLTLLSTLVYNMMRISAYHKHTNTVSHTIKTNNIDSIYNNLIHTTSITSNVKQNSPVNSSPSNTNSINRYNS